MYRIIFLFLLFGPNVMAQFTENWDDDSFSTPPVWQGNLDKYNINTSQQKVFLNAPAESSDAYISTPSEAIGDATWEFTVNMDFNPSSTNYALIFLSTNQAAYNENLEGYYVMVGNTDDEVSLWKRQNGKNVKIIDGTDKILDSPSVSISIKVERDIDGNWHLQTKLPEQSYITEGNTLDNSMTGSKYFGIYCCYTSTRSNKFSFGSITVTGDAFVDTDKPKIHSHQLISGKQFDIVFSENLAASSMSTGNFTIEPGVMHPRTYTLTNNMVSIYFDEYLADTNTGFLHIKDIQDESGNTILDTSLNYSFERIKLVNYKVVNDNSLKLYFNKVLNASIIGGSLLESELNFEPPDFINDSSLLFTSDKPLSAHHVYTLKLSGIQAAFGDIIKDTSIQVIYRPLERHDIVFSEFMPDPSPNVGLWDAEYIELFNRREYPINLEGMKLVINDKQTILPSYELMPNTYVFLINQSYSANLPINSPFIAIKSMPILTNSAGTLILYHANNTVSDVIQYPLGINESSFKTEGGWSFERIDFNNHEPYNNWAYSVNADGGTPGTTNSINASNPDVTAPSVQYISFINSQTFQFVFSEVLKITENFDSSILQVDEAAVSNITVEPIFLNSITVSFSEPLPRDRIFKVNFMRELSDYSGNVLNNNDNETKHSLRIGVPEPLDSFDICINEILFDPKPEDVDFVEIYNRSNKILNRSDIYLASLTDATAGSLIPKALQQIDDKNRLFFPKDHLVITSDVDKTKRNHQDMDLELLIQSNLPAMNDDFGSIAVTKNTGQLIDYFVYNNKMHFELFRNNEGVSLERISTHAVTNTKHNWHSASQQSNYATPTRQNSQYSVYAPSENNNWLSLEREEFSPNNDGVDDYMQINYSLSEPGWTGTVCIYNRYGYPIKTVANNELLGTQGFFTWDGTTENQQKADIGIYIVYVDVFSAHGKRKQQKKTIVLTAGGRR